MVGLNSMSEFSIDGAYKPKFVAIRVGEIDRLDRECAFDLSASATNCCSNLDCAICKSGLNGCADVQESD